MFFSEDKNFDCRISETKDFIKLATKLKLFILKYMDKIADSILNNPDISYDYLLDIRKCLDNITSVLELLEKQLEILNSIATETSNEENINNYNKLYNDNKIKIKEDLKFISDTIFLLTDFIEFNFSNNIVTNNEENLKSTEKEHTPIVKAKEEQKVNNYNLEENTLLLSEIKNAVILPFKLSELEQILQENKEKYTSIEDVILDKYTVPMSNYKHSSLARFREAYSLVRYKSGGSIKEAFDLGIEVFLRYDLNPAIITACKNINQFDVYMSCLDDNVLDEFNFFKIKYEGFPTVSK